MRKPRNSPPKYDISGKKFGRLTAMCYVKSVGWKCRCDCGKESTVSHYNLSNGVVKSCGCAKVFYVSQSLLKHGHCMVGRRTKEYGTWAKMIGRCHTETDGCYHRYGANGIKVCDRWRYSFSNFLEDMGVSPSPLHTIDRKDNSKGYEPSNCRWATRKEQSANRTNCRYLEHDGKRMTIAEWADYLGIWRKTLYNRIDAGLPVTQALVASDRRRLPNSQKLCHIG